MAKNKKTKLIVTTLILSTLSLGLISTGIYLAIKTEKTENQNQTNPNPVEPIPPTTNPEPPITPQVPENQKLNELSEKWKNYQLQHQELEQRVLDSLNSKDLDEINQVFYDLFNDKIDDNGFTYQFNDIVDSGNKITFNLTITDDNTGVSKTISNSFTYEIKKDVPQQLKVYIDKLEAIDWTNFDYDKFGKTHFWEIVSNHNKPFYIMKFIKGFDPNKFRTDNGLDSIKIEDGNLNLDVLKQELTFKITISKNNETAHTKKFHFKYKTPTNYMNPIDVLPSTPEVELNNSLKGLLINVDPRKLSESLYKQRFNDLFADDLFKKIEMLYQIRFIFYQTFGDNATAIDYNIVGNTINLKAKIKDTLIIQNPYIQLLTDEQPKSGFNLKQNDIISLSFSTSNITDKWLPINNENPFGNGSSPWYYGKILDRNNINQNEKVVAFGLSAKNWTIQIKQNNSLIFEKNFNLRSMFSFLLPALK